MHGTNDGTQYGQGREPDRTANVPPETPVDPWRHPDPAMREGRFERPQPPAYPPTAVYPPTAYPQQRPPTGPQKEQMYTPIPGTPEPAKKKGVGKPLAVIFACVAFLCLGGTMIAVLSSGSDPEATVGDDSAAVVGTSIPAEGDKPAAKKDGPATAKLGQTITIRDGIANEDEIRFQVRSVKTATSDNMFTQPGKGKKYVAADISVTMVSGQALMTGSEMTLQAADGEVYQNKWPVVHDDAFQWTNLSEGQKKSGLVFFEVPSGFKTKGAKVVVTSFWEGGKPAGQWQL